MRVPCIPNRVSVLAPVSACKPYAFYFSFLFLHLIGNKRDNLAALIEYANIWTQTLYQV